MTSWATRCEPQTSWQSTHFSHASILCLRQQQQQQQSGAEVARAPNDSSRQARDASTRLLTWVLLLLLLLLPPQPMGVVEQVGPEVKNVKVGDRVVIAFDLGCGHW